MFFIVFAILSCYLIALAIWMHVWIMLWPALSFALVAIAYAGVGPSLLGKQINGRFAWWALILLFPYLLLIWLLWHLTRLLNREGCCNQVASGIWIGRRAAVSEIPSDVNAIVDLTSELYEPRGVTQIGRYFCLPTLDGMPPDEKRFRELIEELKDWQGTIYIHCAVGHGRSAMLTVALLMIRGLASNPSAAMKIVKAARPRARLKKAQRHFLKQCEIS